MLNAVRLISLRKSRKQYINCLYAKHVYTEPNNLHTLIIHFDQVLSTIKPITKNYLIYKPISPRRDI